MSLKPNEQFTTSAPWPIAQSLAAMMFDVRYDGAPPAVVLFAERSWMPRAWPGYVEFRLPITDAEAVG